MGLTPLFLFCFLPLKIYGFAQLSSLFFIVVFEGILIDKKHESGVLLQRTCGNGKSVSWEF
jgi:hypothetical protein